MKDKYTLLLEQLESDLKRKKHEKEETEQKIAFAAEEVTHSNRELARVYEQLGELSSDKKSWNTVAQRKKKNKTIFIFSSLAVVASLFGLQYAMYWLNRLNDHMLALFYYPISLKPLFILCDIVGSGWLASFYYRQIYKKYKKDDSDVDAIFSKYPSLADIEQKIEKKKRKKEDLINKIHTHTREKFDLRFLLAQINIDISTLEGKIVLTKEAIVAKCKILNNSSFEKQLDEQFDQEKFDAQLAGVDVEGLQQNGVLARTKPNTEIKP